MSIALGVSSGYRTGDCERGQCTSLRTLTMMGSRLRIQHLYEEWPVREGNLLCLA